MSFGKWRNFMLKEIERICVFWFQFEWMVWLNWKVTFVFDGLLWNWELFWSSDLRIMCESIHKSCHRDIFLIFVFLQTPLQIATFWGIREVVEILLRNGANIHEKDVRNDRNEKWWRRWKDWETEWTNMEMGIWEADGLCVCEERRKICVFEYVNGFAALETDILFFCFGFVNCLDYLIIEQCMNTLILFSSIGVLLSVSLCLSLSVTLTLSFFHFALFHIFRICSLTVNDLRGYTLLDRRMKRCHNIHQIHAKYEEREKERERKKMWIGRGRGFPYWLMNNA